MYLVSVAYSEHNPAHICLDTLQPLCPLDFSLVAVSASLLWKTSLVLLILRLFLIFHAAFLVFQPWTAGTWSVSSIFFLFGFFIIHVRFEIFVFKQGKILLKFIFLLFFIINQVQTFDILNWEMVKWIYGISLKIVCIEIKENTIYRIFQFILFYEWIINSSLLKCSVDLRPLHYMLVLSN